jgi:hypothetical protein
MNFDLTSLPNTIDMVHIIFALISIILFVLLTKKAATSDKSTTSMDQATADAKEDKPPETEPTQSKPEPIKLKEASPDAALQLLTLLQQDARFIDFINEDLSDFSDADIGAAARVVHEGGKKTLENYFTLEAVRNEDEEARITLEEGFNAAEVRLIGNVVGDAPFSGTLIHKGWKVSEIKLPKIAQGHDVSILAPAEVEL